MSNDAPISLQELNVEIADATKVQLRQSPEVLQIANSIDIKRQDELMALGLEPATKLSRFSDQILKMMAVSKLNESGELIKQLETLMMKFDKGEVFDQQSFFGKLFKRAPKNVDNLYAKYNSLGREIEKVHYQFVLMEEMLVKDNQMLASLYQEDIDYYLALEKYIVAVELILEEVTLKRIPMCEQGIQKGNQMARIELNNLQAIAELLTQKIDELDRSRLVAILAAPQIQMIRNSNHELMEQINRAFIKTIPVFKMGIIQAVNERKQKLHSDSIKAFENRAKQFGNVNSEFLQQSVLMANEPANTMTLENVWETILVGISDYNKMRDEQVVQRNKGQQQFATLIDGVK
ncbi:MAG: toxic anion resistance protein [Lysinibacillus sp.]